MTTAWSAMPLGTCLPALLDPGLASGMLTVDQAITGGESTGRKRGLAATFG